MVCCSTTGWFAKASQRAAGGRLLWSALDIAMFWISLVFWYGIRMLLFMQKLTTAGFLIHGRHARIFAQIVNKICCLFFWPGFLARVFWTENTVYRSTGTEKYSLTVLPGQRNTVLQVYWDGERRERNHVSKSQMIKNPIYSKPSCKIQPPRKNCQADHSRPCGFLCPVACF